MIKILAGLARKQWEKLLLRPFWRLVAHFCQRLFSGGDDAGEGELNLGVGAMLALLATPGLFISVLLFDKYSSLIHFFRGGPRFDAYAQSLPDQYFFFTFSMVITGIVTALKWDSIFPDRRDYINLAPLPLPAHNIFLANLTAIVVIAIFFAIDVNSVSTFLFPLLVTMESGTFHDYLRFVGIQATGVMLCSLFMFFALFAVIGTLMAILPIRAFRKLSLYIRVTVVIAMLTLLCASFAVPALLRDSLMSHSTLLGWLPPVWFLGFARSLIGQAEPQLVSLGVFGLRMLLGAVAVAAVSYVISYYRYFIRIPEMLDATIRKREPRSLVPAWILDRLLRTPFERACYRFTLKTLLRNERQSLILGGFMGLGLVIASQTLVAAHSRKAAGPASFPSQDFLSVPLILAYFVLCGSRFVFELPAELRANWAPQVIVDREKHQAVPVARKVMLSLVWPWVLLIGLPLYAYFWGWTLALGHIAAVMILTYCLADFLLRHFRKIPFTCAYSAWKQNATVVVILYAVGFLIFTTTTTSLEHSLLLRHPLLLFPVAVAFLGAWQMFSRLRKDEFDPTNLLFEDAPAPAVELLNLTGR